jgi:hypothetical protein
MTALPRYTACTQRIVSESTATHGAGLGAELAGVEPQEPRFCHAHTTCHVVVALPRSSGLVDGPACAPLPQNGVVSGYFPSVVTHARVARGMLWKPEWVIHHSSIPGEAHSLIVARYTCPDICPILATPGWRHAGPICCGGAVANALACCAIVEADIGWPVAASLAADVVDTHAVGSTRVAASSHVEEATFGLTRAGVALHKVSPVIVNPDFRTTAPGRA